MKFCSLFIYCYFHVNLGSSATSALYNVRTIPGASSKPHVKLLAESNSWARLQCEVHGAHPQPKVEWWDSSGNILPAEEPQVSERGGSYDVILHTTVTKTDNYSCVATQEEIKHQISAETLVHISGAATKPFVTIIEETKDFSLLQCEILGAFPKPLLQWTDSSGNILPAAEPQVSERGGSYEVILQTTVTKTDNYSCVASQDNHQSKPAHIYVSLSDPSGGFSVAGVLCIILFVVVFVCIVVGVLVCTGCIPLICNNVEEKGNTPSSNSLPAKSEDSETVQLKI